MGRVSLDQAKLKAVATGPKLFKLMEKRAEQINEAAKDIFLANSHGRSSPNVAEQYINHFVVEREGDTYLAKNTDAQWFWVEFGAHAGGKTPVLGYAPLRRGLDTVSSLYG